MTMEEKNKNIEEYIKNKAALINSKYKGLVKEDQINRAINMFSDSNDDFETVIKPKIDELAQRVIDDHLERIRKMFEKQLDKIDFEHKGITINEQDIDLMMIANASSKEELQEALSKITNIKPNIDFDSPNFNLEEEKARVFEMYTDSLTSKNDYFADKGIDLQKKLEYLFDSGILNESESAELKTILDGEGTTQEKLKAISTSETLSTKLPDMLSALRDRSPIEKSGERSFTIESAKKLAELVDSRFDSITIDEEFKYGKIVSGDKLDYKHLEKTLDFARKHGKMVRANALIFYMDCPENLYNLEKNDTNKEIVKAALLKYVDGTTKFISEYEQKHGKTVRSVDALNELLNRFSDDGNFDYRGVIPQGNGKDDNIKSGWLKHLDIKDLCDAIAVARRNLPNTDFMYNDDNLLAIKKDETTGEIRYPKIEALSKHISDIRKYEAEHGIKLIDSIGTQMHIDSGVSKEQIKGMLIELSKFGLPIEITEFDLAMTSKDLEGLSQAEIELKRQEKIAEIYECISELRQERKDIDLRGFTIWSKTDKQNFRVSLENEKRISSGETPISTYYGGMYTEDFEYKSMKDFMYDPNEPIKYNFHGHSYLCGHASFEDTIEDYVKVAREKGITKLGFSDHVPVPKIEYPDPEMRMCLDEVDEYISSIQKAKEKNKDMTIICGFEAEYDPSREKFYGDLRKRKGVDYMILGQHYVPGIDDEQAKGNIEYPLRYADVVCQGISTGIFDIVAHPDEFMKYFETIPDDKKAEYKKNVKLAAKQICESAKEMGLPLELNLGTKEGEGLSPVFWEVAAESQVLVVWGSDAHCKEQIAEMDGKRKEVSLDTSKLNIVGNNYNPVVSRQYNTAIQKRFTERQQVALSPEEHLEKTVKSYIDRGVEASELSKLNKEQAYLRMKKSNKKAIDAENNPKISKKEKFFWTKRNLKSLTSIDDAHVAREGIIKRVVEAKKITSEPKNTKTNPNVRKLIPPKANTASQSGFVDIIIVSIITIALGLIALILYKI